MMGTSAPDKKADGSSMPGMDAAAQESSVEVGTVGAYTQENVYYDDEPTNYSYRIDDAMSALHLETKMPTIDLMGFISRPVLIETLTWNVGSGLEFADNPWFRYFENSSVRDKLRNFYRLQCKLKLKVVVVGNQFNFGRLMLGWQPLTSSTPSFNYNSFTQWGRIIDPLFTPGNHDLVFGSQLPHIYLDPSDSSGGEIVLPFLFYKQYMEIPTRDWQEMGSYFITTFSPLQAANGSVDPVTIQIIAQPVDIHMDVPTQFTAQMNSVMRSMSAFDPKTPVSSAMGVVSAGAGAVAKAQGGKKKKKNKKIKTGAKAVQIGAQLAGSMAAKFGFTRQVDATGTQGFVPRYCNDVAITDGTTETIPLSCYKDTQVTISSDRYGAGNTDDMAITSVACRESFLTKFSWNASDVPGTNLFAAEVTPSQYTIDPSTGAIAQTPMCFACMPFELWSGDIEFRFQVVSSNFHKGILVIKYDPDAEASGQDFNLQTLAIIDISKDRDVKVKVGMSQPTPWLYHRALVDAPVGFSAGGGPPPYSTVGPYVTNGSGTITQIAGAYNFNYIQRLAFNGVISVQVFNALVVPGQSTATSVEVLVSCNAGDNFKVAAPTDMYIRDVIHFPFATTPALQLQRGADGTFVSPQSIDIDGSVDRGFTSQMNTNDVVSPDDGAPVGQSIAHHFGAEYTDTGCGTDIHIGEDIDSLRVLVRRQQYYGSQRTAVGATLFHFTLVNPDFPEFPGNTPIQLGLTRNKYANMTYLHWITPAYGMRSGSMRSMYVSFPATNNDFRPSQFRVARCAKGIPTSSSAVELNNGASDLGDYTNIYNGATNQRQSANAGAHVQVPQQNPVLDVQLPFYEPITGYPATNAIFADGNIFTRSHSVEGVTRTAQFVYRWVSGGPDFNLGMFLAVPFVFARDFTAPT